MSLPHPDFGSLFELEHDLPDELISSSDLGLTNGGDASQLHTSLGGLGGGIGGGSQDAAAKHKQLSELLRGGAPAQPGVPTSNNTPSGTSMGMMGSISVSPGGPQGLHPQGQQQQPGLTQQVGMVGGVAALSRTAAMMGAQNGNTGQQHQGLMGGQVMNGSPRMGYPGNAGMGNNNNNVLPETLQQHQGSQQMGAGGQARPQQPGVLSKVGTLVAAAGPNSTVIATILYHFFRCIKPLFKTEKAIPSVSSAESSISMQFLTRQTISSTWRKKKMKADVWLCVALAAASQLSQWYRWLTSLLVVLPHNGYDFVPTLH